MHVHVSHHAQDRLAARCLERTQSSWVVEEVKAAITEGRMAKRPPTWCRGRNGARARGKRNGEGHFRYVWPPSEDRVYYLARVHDGWVVVTILLPS